MTQVKSAQGRPSQVALRQRADARTLAQRRADFAAQMREMALSDLSQVSKRLKQLHKELEQKDGRRWTHYELAAAMKIPPRTFQSWEGGEVENRDGKGYEKMARWYSRKLGRRITRGWIVFGDEEQSAPAQLKAANGPGATQVEKEVADLREQVGGIDAQLASALPLLEQLSEGLKSLQADVATLKRRQVG